MRCRLSIFFAAAFFLLAVYAEGDSNMLCQGAYWSEDEAFAKMKEFAAEWKTLPEWKARAERIKHDLLKGLRFDEMPKINGNFHPILNNSRKMDGYIVENVAIESFPGFYITGNIYRPLNSQGRLPAVLRAHGHWDDGRMREAAQISCAVFARMGAVVFAYDMVGFGDSKQVTHDISIAALLQTWNSRRVLDYLISRDDVDPKRIGMTGASGGGTQTFLLSAIDDRIAAAAPVVQVSAHFFGGCVCESGMPIHKSSEHQTNNVEIAALTAPRPLLIVSDGGDWTRNTPRVEYPYIKRVYETFGMENRVSNVHFPTQRHDYNSDKRKAVYNFFIQYLGLVGYEIPKGGDGYDESFVKALPIDDLRVFNEKTPMPDSALPSNDAVVLYLNLKARQ